MKNLSRNSKYFAGIVGLGVLILLVLGFNNRISEMRRLSIEAENMSQDVDQLEQTRVVLATQIAFAASDAAVEAWAYEEARWIREGDYPIVPFSPNNGTPEPASVLVNPQASTENWRVWKALFFDPTLP
jgi:hypothetical protein